MAETAFAVSGIDVTGEFADLLGVWQRVPDDTDTMRSFSIAPEPTSGPVWSAWLPETPSQASMHLSAAEAMLVKVHQNVPRAQDRLDDVLARLQTPNAGRSLTIDEAQLFENVSSLRDTGGVSFGLVSGVTSSWIDASERALAAVKQVQAGISASGLVETHVGELLIGQTHAGLLGAERTVLRADTTPAQMDLHLRTVTLSLSSRVAMVSMLAAAVRGAARLSLALTLPGGPLLLVPSVLRFVAATAAAKP